METYKVALEATGGVFGGVEPVSRFHEAFQGPIDAAYAAAAVGLQTEAPSLRRFARTRDFRTLDCWR